MQTTLTRPAATPAAVAPMARYPEPAGYVAAWKRGQEITRSGNTVTLSWNGPALDAHAFDREMRRALDRRINERAGLAPDGGSGRKWHPEYQYRMMRDGWRLNDRARTRVRVYDLDTPELRRRLAHRLNRREER